MSQPSQEIEQQFNALIAAIKSGCHQQVEHILQHSPSCLVHRIEPQFREPALYFAALVAGDQCSAELIKLLIRNGANVNFKDHNEQSILFYICREGKEQCAELLLSHGLSLDDMDIYGQTPMFYAVSEDRLGLVQRYATRSRVNHADKLSRQTPLYYAARKGHLQMARLLIEKGADLTHLDTYSKTSADTARKAKFHELAEYLTSELKKLRESNKSNSEEPERKQNSVSSRRKDETVRDARQTYRIVLLNDKGEPRELSEEEVRQLVSERAELAGYMSNPESIPAETLTAVEEENSWQKCASRVLSLSCKLKGAYYFLEAVDPVKFNIMDYFDIVSRPMDLGMVRKKLNYNCYQHPAQFVADMNLIWNNSYKYNGDGHVVSKCAQELQQGFKGLVVSQGLDLLIENGNGQERPANQQAEAEGEQASPEAAAATGQNGQKRQKIQGAAFGQDGQKQEAEAAIAESGQGREEAFLKPEVEGLPEEGGAGKSQEEQGEKEVVEERGYVSERQDEMDRSLRASEDRDEVLVQEGEELEERQKLLQEL